MLRPQTEVLLSARERRAATVLAADAPLEAIRKRARILLLAADGLSNIEIATRIGTNRATVRKWRSRFADAGLSALSEHRTIRRLPHAYR